MIFFLDFRKKRDRLDIVYMHYIVGLFFGVISEVKVIFLYFIFASK